MNEAARKARNRAELELTHPDWHPKFKELVEAMERHGRPRLQDTWRSNASQLKKFKSGMSQVRSGGPHTYTANWPTSLAIHVLDDDNPLAPGSEWIAHLAIEAHKLGLQTGCAWSKSARSLVAPGMPHRLAIEHAVRTHDLEALVGLLDRVRGFDPLHVEVPGWRAIMRGNL
jgi:hypothetical protein